MILLAILFPPLYFLKNKKTGMALLTGVMFIVSVFLAITVVLLPGSLTMWLISALLAVWHYRRRDREEHAEMLAAKMAEKMRDTRGTPPVIPPKNRTGGTAMRNLILLACAFALACLLAGCTGAPSESSGRRLMEKRVADQSGSKIVLVSFKKTNGMLDGNLYQMEYEAEVEFPSSGSWQRGSALDSSVSFGFSPQPVPNNNLAQLMGGAMGAVNVRQGEHQAVKGVLRFQKTEKGWMGEDGQVY